MKFQNIITDNILQACPITLQNYPPEIHIQPGQIGDVILQNKKFYLKVNQKLHEFTVENHGLQREFDNYLQYMQPNKCMIESVINDKLQITVLFFNKLLIFGNGRPGKPDLIINYDDNLGSEKKSQNTLKWIKSLNIHLECNGRNYFLINTAEENLTAKSLMNQGKKFAIYTDNHILPIEQLEFNDESILTLRTPKPQAWNKPVNTLKLVQGTIAFSREKNVLSPIIAGAMKNLMTEENSYMKKWDEYSKLEGEILLKQARDIKNLPITKQPELTSEGLLLSFGAPIPKTLSKNDCLQIVEQLPLFLTDDQLSWEEYQQALINGYQLTDLRKSPPLKIKNINHRKRTILLDSNKGEKLIKKHVILSIFGDEIQMKRRAMARKAVIEGSAAKPYLGMLIEGETRLPPRRQPHTNRLKTSSSFVKSKIFKNPPTTKQLEAIHIALNTPDIALIQGPPGTGKTTVIMAILERLNEEFDSSQSMTGQALITAFQHSAVENIIDRLSINDIPTIKFGRKAGVSPINNKLQTWLEDISANIKKQHPEITEVSQISNMDRFANTYLISKTPETAILFLDVIILNDSQMFSLDVIKEARRIRQDLQPKPCNDTQLKIIRQLRTNRHSFQDDGVINATIFYDTFEDIIEDTAREFLTPAEVNTILEACSLRSATLSADFFESLTKIQHKFLDKYLPDIKYARPKLNQDVLNLMARAQQDMANYRGNSKQDKTSVLYDLTNEIDTNLYGIRDALKEYNFAFSSTTQAAEGWEIRNAKGVHYNERVVYDTVIVDEAARVSPRDLLIPMVQGKNRIIIVGDHRQLPHIIDEQIAQDLEDAKDSADHDNYITTSLFQHLFKRLQILAKYDNIPRTITLDAQYRMHELLGDFASEHFYEEFGEGFESPLDGSYFEHNLSGIEGKQAVWMNISHGEEQRNSNKSRYRLSEASAIAKQLHEWMTNPTNDKLSFGVISFYRAQVETVLQELHPYGITTKTMEGQYSIVPAYQKRLQVGTVDSFQGMEFDVVFLSMVRAPISYQGPEYQRMFGFLMSKNRLCVSMTRQKRVLILVGDDQLFASDAAKEGVPEIYDFYHLCQQQGKVIPDENSL